MPLIFFWLTVILGTVILYGLLTVLIYWGKYAIACLYLVIPVFTPIVIFYDLLIVIPIAIFAPDSALAKNTQWLAHWFNDQAVDMIFFLIMLPFNTICFVTTLMYKILNHQPLFS